MGLNKRELLRLGAASVASAAASYSLARYAAPEEARPFAIVAPTFDTYASTYHVAFPTMRARGLVGTFFVEPFHVDKIEGAPTSAMLREMQSAGWEIGAYSGPNMVALYAQGEDAARAHLVALRVRMHQLGFPALSLAPNQRSWSPGLRELARGLFAFVRVADTAGVQPLPISDALSVRLGATASLSADDTRESLRADALKAVKARGLWPIVVHQVGNDCDPLYSIPEATFDAFCSDLAQLVDAGVLRAMTFAQACTLSVT